MDLKTSRLERSRNQRRQFWRNIFNTPKLLLFLGVSLFIYFVSIGTWVNELINTKYEDLLLTILTVNIMSVGLFIAIGYANVKVVVSFVKSLVKIAFTVWVVLIVQFSSMNQMEQNSWLIICAVFFVYFEVFTDFNTLFHEINDYQSSKVRFLNTEFLKEYSVPLSIILTAIINVIISFFISDLLKTLGM